MVTCTDTEEDLPADVVIGPDRSYYQITEVYFAVGKKSSSRPSYRGPLHCKDCDSEVTHGHWVFVIAVPWAVNRMSLV